VECSMKVILRGDVNIRLILSLLIHRGYSTGNVHQRMAAEGKRQADEEGKWRLDNGVRRQVVQDECGDAIGISPRDLCL